MQPFVFFLLFLSFIESIRGYSISQTIKSDRGWVYLDRFLFNPSTNSGLAGNIGVEILMNPLDNISLMVFTTASPGEFMGILNEELVRIHHLQNLPPPSPFPFLSLN